MSRLLDLWRACTAVMVWAFRAIWWRARVRLAWPALSRALGLGRTITRNERETWRPAPLRIRTDATAAVVTVRVPIGKTAADVARAADALAAAVRAHSAHVTARCPSSVRLRLVMVDVLSTTRAAAAPAPVGPVLLGRREDGTPLTWDPLTGGHIGLQGQTGSGKSVALYTLLGGLSSRDDVSVLGLDPSGVLLGPWAGRHPVGVMTGTSDTPRHLAVLTAAVAEMDARTAALGDRDQLTAFDRDRPVLVIVLEEWPGMIAAAKAEDDAEGRKAGARIAPAMTAAVGRLLREGRKVGVRVIVAAQRMSTGALDGDDRGQLSTRITLRCDNRDAIRMLHEGVDVDPETVRQLAPGQCLVETPGAAAGFARIDRMDYAGYRSLVLLENPCQTGELAPTLALVASPEPVPAEAEAA